MKILIMNGPNLNLLGVRQPEIYGTRDNEMILAELRHRFPQVELDYYQSNHEGALIDRLQDAGYGAEDERADAVVLNAGAYTHTSLALADAIAAIPVPVIEVHLSNTAAREQIRHRSLIAPVCRGSIAGFGAESYAMALYYLTANSI